MQTSLAGISPALSLQTMHAATGQMDGSGRDGLSQLLVVVVVDDDDAGRYMHLDPCN
jgi:hypothetical protein